MTPKTPQHRPASNRSLLSLIGLLGILLSFGLTSTPAVAAEEPDAQEGWARVAHLSPDTTSVDVALTAVAGGRTLFSVDDVAYGDVSDYWRLAAGTYLVEMVPTGSPADAAPAISEVIAVEEGQPITLAVLGANADLSTKVIEDDLTPPADGKARVRVIQASTVAESVDIATTSGEVIATDAGQGQVTGYATVDDGRWDLELESDTASSSATIDLRSGSVNTLLVLDNADDGLTIKAISDSGSVLDTPVGGTNTGAAPVGTEPLSPGWGVLAAGSLLGLTALMVLRTNRRSTTTAAAPRP